MNITAVSKVLSSSFLSNKQVTFPCGLSFVTNRLLDPRIASDVSLINLSPMRSPRHQRNYSISTSSCVGTILVHNMNIQKTSSLAYFTAKNAMVETRISIVLYLYYYNKLKIQIHFLIVFFAIT